METVINKSRVGGWKARSSVALDDIGLESKLAMFSTYRNDRGTLVTTARVEHDKGDFTSHNLFFDYCKTIIATSPSRVTAKVVEAQHAQIDLDMIKDDIIQFYKLKKQDEKELA